MDFNARKCKVLSAARIRSIDDRDCYLSGIKLDRVDVEKDLRVLVSHTLSRNSHIDLISSKAQRILNVLYQKCTHMANIHKRIRFVKLMVHWYQW